MKSKKTFLKIQLLLISVGVLSAIQYNLPAQTKKTNLNKEIISIETGYTISKVRTAQNTDESYIIGSSYEGTVLGVSHIGEVLWENKLSGFMNHDLWCEDITGNGIDEIIAANANGTIYCLNNKGELLWKFKQNDAPMYSVCTIKKGNENYVVCGGYDKSIYYLNSKGKQIK